MEKKVGKTTSILADFVTKVDYHDLPEAVVTEVKKVILDSIGCALAGALCEKGKVSIVFAKKSDSSSGATIIGANQKVSSSMAAFANGELITALDYDPLFAPFGHITPYVLSAPLAIAEMEHASGKDFLVAVVLAHEIAWRIAAGLIIPERLGKKTEREGIVLIPPIHGYGVNIFGGIAGVSKLFGLNRDTIEHALGIGGYLCPVPTLMQFAENVPSSMSKFSPAGWIAQAELTAIFLAVAGYTGDKNVLDGNFGFWKSFGADGWRPEIVIKTLGQRWYLPEMIGYKRYPCCGAMHPALDILSAIIAKFDLKPENIKEINVVLNLLAELELWKNRDIKTHIEAQFSAAYVFSLVCHRVEAGYKWQIPQTYNDPKILDFMEKINIFTPASPDYEKKENGVEVIAYDNKTKKEKRYTERDVWASIYQINDQELYEKFISNAREVIPAEKARKVFKTILTLDELDDVSKLMHLVIP
jgi:2-methylcitrate dehydratase PrpD